MSGEKTGMNLCDCGFSEPSLMWLLPGREVTGGICDCPRTMSGVCTSSPNVVRDGVAAVMSIGAWKLPEPPIRQSHTTYVSHRSSWLRPPILGAAIHQASSVSAENSPCGAVLFWRMSPSPSQVHHHHHSACRALYLLQHLPHLPHPAHCWNLQDRSNCLQ